MALIASWWAYKRSIVKLADLRVWLAIFEVMARRCGDRPRRFPPGVEHELVELTGLSIEVVCSALRRLERTGLVRRHKTAFEPVLELSRLNVEEQEDFRRTLAKIANHRRRIPVPRRLLRFLCVTHRQVLLATTLGHLLRCMYYRDRQCAPDGRCKASWVAEVMEVDLRNVKAARRELLELGVLVIEPTHQCQLNRWGPSVRFNLDWRAPRPAQRPPPLQGARPHRIPPPYEDRELASRLENQEPADGNALVPKARRCWHVDVDELSSPVRLQSLYERCVALRLCRGGEAARLAFFATAVRALRVASTNTAGLFATLVRGGCWQYATLADEDLARRWVQKLDAAEPLKHRDPTIDHRPMTVEPMGRRPESVGTVLSRLLGRDRIRMGTASIAACRAPAGRPLPVAVCVPSRVAAGPSRSMEDEHARAAPPGPAPTQGGTPLSSFRNTTNQVPNAL